MNQLFKYSLSIILLFMIISSCNKGPKVIPPKDNTINAEKSSGIFSRENQTDEHVHTSPSISEDIHTVIAKKTLQTTKYVYILVSEGAEEYWIATNKQDIQIGGAYFFRGGLLKTNFESKEHNKTFDKIILVSKLVSSNHGETTDDPTGMVSTSVPKSNINVKGSVKISDLVASPEKYEGKSIQISGECVKINPNIMGRNWIHLNDGSKSDYDLVITSDIAVPIGHKVTMVGTVVLNKDFGAGYKYDILLENATIVK